LIDGFTVDKATNDPDARAQAVDSIARTGTAFDSVNAMFLFEPSGPHSKDRPSAADVVQSHGHLRNEGWIAMCVRLTIIRSMVGASIRRGP
jgi:hypothetical protein